MSYLMLEYVCRRCGTRIESLELRSAPACTIPHTGCGTADRAISAVRHATRYATVTRGKSDEPPPNVVDTRPLAEGMPRREWLAKRRAKQRDRRRAEIRNLTS